MSTLKVDTIQHSGGTTGLTINSSGRVTDSNKIAFLVIGNAEAYVTTSPIIPATIKYNYGSGWDASTGRFTCPSGGAGLYSFQLHMGIVNITTGGGNCYPRMFFYNAAGTQVFAPYSYWSHPDTASYGSTHINTNFVLAEGDYVYLTFSQTNAVYYDNASELGFQGTRIG